MATTTQGGTLARPIIPHASICFELRRGYSIDFRDDELEVVPGTGHIYLGARYLGTYRADTATLILDRNGNTRRRVDLSGAAAAAAAYSGTPADEPSGPARSDDPELDDLYAQRRAAAETADAPGQMGAGWAKLEAIEAELRQRDPDGDWQYEGNRWDGRGWTVRRPVRGVA
jgi:hypothetical protein